MNSYDLLVDLLSDFSQGLISLDGLWRQLESLDNDISGLSVEVSI